MSRPAAAPRTISALTAGQPLTLDDRLALANLAMDDRLNGAGLQLDVRTAHIDIPEILVEPTPPAVPTTPTTVEEVLQTAARLIAAHGWIRGYAGSQATGYCLIGAIQAAAGGNQRLEDAAEQLILERIRAGQPDVISAGAWNDAQQGPVPVLRILG